MGRKAKRLSPSWTELLKFFESQQIFIKRYKTTGDGGLEAIYKGRCILFTREYIDTMPNWDAKTKKLVLDSVRYGSADKAKKARAERRKKKK